MQTIMVLDHHMSLRVLDTQLSAQGMETIGEIRYFLVPFLTRGGPFSVLDLVASNGIVLFFNGIQEGIPCWGNHKYCIFLYGPLLRVSVPPVLNMGDGLEDYKSNLFPIEKIVDRKYPSSRFNHLSTPFASISTSNNGISKFTCTLKGVSWPLDEHASPVGNRRKICAKLSIISFLCHTSSSSSNILKGSHTPSSFFSSPMGCFRVWCGRACNGSIGSSPSFLYQDLVGDIQEEK
jgi:hypothetical protein